MAAHWALYPSPPIICRRALALFQEREKLYQKLFPHDDVNFGTDPCWIRAYPYRQKILPGAKTEIEARIMNHSGKPKRGKGCS